ncbi:MAG: AAA family ATPase [Proteobacteria bacterium]|nr:AAA family ATPase [Pseudomonadota bacterium]
MYRELEENLDAWRHNVPRKPLILKGARQVGKTYILKDWGAKAFPKVHYINFEKTPQAASVFELDFDVKRIVREIGFQLRDSIDPTMDLLILDEIQAAPRALTALKYFCEDLPDFAVCTAGSLLGVILSEESFPVGKVTFLHLHPMNFSEFLAAIDERKSHEWLPSPSLTAQVPLILHEYLWNMLKIYYIVGGMPEAVSAYKRHILEMHKAFKQVRNVQRDLLQTYEGDFAKHAGKLNAVHIQALYRNIPKQLASTQDDSVQRFKFNDVMQGKKGFASWERPLHWLINAGLALQVKISSAAKLPIEHYCKDNIFKLFMHDVGLLGCAQNLEPGTLLNQDYGLAKGFFAENFVAQELRAAHCQQLWPLYGWNERTSEVEFVIQYQESVVPIEVKAPKICNSKKKQSCYSFHYTSQVGAVNSSTNCSGSQ